MARSSLQLVVDQRTPLNINDKSPKAGRQLLRKVIRQLEGILGGVVDASHIVFEIDGAQPVAASATITMNAANDNDTCTINGVAFTAVTGAPSGDQWDDSGNATAEAVSLAAQINASSTAAINKHVEASNFAGVVALASVPAGTIISIAGHNFVAIAAANTTPQAQYGDFSISGNDTADGTALADAINAHPVLSHQVVASNSSGTVTIRQRRGTSALGKILTTSPSTVTVTQFASTATILVSALHEGYSGNAITLAESTSSARLSVSGARLSGGTGGSSGTRIRMVVGGSAN